MPRAIAFFQFPDVIPVTGNSYSGRLTNRSAFDSTGIPACAGTTSKQDSYGAETEIDGGPLNRPQGEPTLSVTANQREAC